MNDNIIKMLEEAIPDRPADASSTHIEIKHNFIIHNGTVAFIAITIVAALAMAALFFSTH